MTFPRSLYRWNFIAGTHPTPSEGESTVLRARQLPLDRRQVNFLVLDNRVLIGNMLGNVAEDPFLAYQEAAKVVSAKKGSASKTASGDDVMVTGSRRAAAVKVNLSSSSQGKKPKGGGATTRSA
ncbi:hypothetical protein Bca52824_033148 [Brassica carinata]|uniref:Uncharacterized protein n=1 Tax=Brassica carinata TaxID=52824 RepID=A0A8X7SEG7_BRACI|nr:hypothetical protein Bca52824_033148 [Brassica carinata]